MKIVILDGYTTNPGDLDWNALHTLGDCTVFDRSLPTEVVDRASQAEVVLTNKTPLDASTISKLPLLKYIGVLATGYNVVDITAAKAAGVVVSNIPAYGTASVAQHAFALLLELTNSVGDHAKDVADGGWSSSVDWSYWKRPPIELQGLTLGLIGQGRIGAAFARICEAVGMTTQSIGSKSNPADLNEILCTSDVVSLHCPLTPATREIINSGSLSLFRSSAFLINTSRGPLINEQDLADALNLGGIAGAALDVLSAEPPSTDNPLFHAKNCIITPHIAWAALASRCRLLAIATHNVNAFLSGHPQNVVS